jgi:uncharacterized repeat protein (TIGR03847 family)
MARLVYDFNPVTHITIGTVGSPGQRVFYLQASQGSTLVTLKIEKEQAYHLAAALDQLLHRLAQKYPGLLEGESVYHDTGLQHPIEPDFTVGQIGLGYDEDQNLLILAAYQLPSDPEEPEDIAIARFWATPGQMRALSERAKEAVVAGRPICPLCKEPIDPEGHFCPGGNGDGQKY